MRADSIRARGPATAPHLDAGYMAATSPSADRRIHSCNAGRTIYGSQAVPPDAGTLLEPALEGQQRRGVEAGKARDTRLIHPAHQLTQVLEIVGSGPCTLRQPRTQRAAADQGDEPPAALQQRRVPLVGETPPVGEREAPANAYRFRFFQRGGRLEDPERIVPSRVEQEPSSIGRQMLARLDIPRRVEGASRRHGCAAHRKSGNGGSCATNACDAASSLAVKRGRMSSSRIRSCGA